MRLLINKLWDNVLKITRLKPMEAKDLLLKSSAPEEVAEQFAIAAKRYVEEKVIQPLESKLAEQKERLFDLKRINIESDKNRGIEAITMDQCKERFVKIINLEYEITLTELELKQKKASYEKYFDDKN